MIIEDKRYFVEFNLKSLAKGALVGSLAGGALLGGIVGGAKSLGIGRFARQQPTQSAPQIASTTNQSQQSQQSQQQNVKTTSQTTTKQAEDKFEFESPHMERLYGALVSAEHRGFVDDPLQYDARHFIRTKVKGKLSAYGPLQLTKNVIEGFMIPNFQYQSDLVNQGTNFLNSKSNDPVYGAGKPGTLSGKENYNNYKRVAQAVIKGKAKEAGLDPNKQLTQDELYKFATHYNQGLASGKKPQKWYTDTIHNYYYGK